MEREKGARAERAFASICHDNGYDARRTAQYCGKTGDAADVVGLPGIHVECKHVERLNLRDAMAQAVRDSGKSGRLPIVAHKKNRAGWLVTMRVEDWFELYREWEAGHE